MRLLIVLCVVAFVAQCVVLARGYTPGVGFDVSAATPEWAVHRAAILAQLQKDANQHLIIVRYAPDHPWYRHWIFNEADIDHAKVVWARDMGEEKNRELLDYFKGRKIWLLEADANPPKLVPYPGM